jgi:hypothetical protein
MKSLSWIDRFSDEPKFFSGEPKRPFGEGAKAHRPHHDKAMTTTEASVKRARGRDLLIPLDLANGSLVFGFVRG